MSAEDLEQYESELELQLYREYKDVVGIFTYAVETERRFYLCNAVDLKVRTEGGDVYYEVSMSDAWVWDMYRPARFVKSAKVLTFRDVSIEEIAHSDLEVPKPTYWHGSHPSRLEPPRRQSSRTKSAFAHPPPTQRAAPPMLAVGHLSGGCRDQCIVVERRLQHPLAAGQPGQPGGQRRAPARPARPPRPRRGLRASIGVCGTAPSPASTGRIGPSRSAGSSRRKRWIGSNTAVPAAASARRSTIGVSSRKSPAVLDIDLSKVA